MLAPLELPVEHQNIASEPGVMLPEESLSENFMHESEIIGSPDIVKMPDQKLNYACKNNPPSMAIQHNAPSYCYITLDRPS